MPTNLEIIEETREIAKQNLFDISKLSIFVEMQQKRIEELEAEKCRIEKAERRDYEILFEYLGN